jgi:hypothetical protein
VLCYHLCHKLRLTSLRTLISPVSICITSCATIQISVHSLPYCVQNNNNAAWLIQLLRTNSASKISSMSLLCVGGHFCREQYRAPYTRLMIPNCANQEEHNKQKRYTGVWYLHSEYQIYYGTLFCRKIDEVTKSQSLSVSLIIAAPLRT